VRLIKKMNNYCNECELLKARILMDEKILEVITEKLEKAEAEIKRLKKLECVLMPNNPCDKCVSNSGNYPYCRIGTNESEVTK
jgi:hypothetical protein